jgi:hypothetical protein
VSDILLLARKAAPNTVSNPTAVATPRQGAPEFARNTSQDLLMRECGCGTREIAEQAMSNHGFFMKDLKSYQGG